jgi:hypothetical protein
MNADVFHASKLLHACVYIPDLILRCWLGALPSILFLLRVFMHSTQLIIHPPVCMQPYANPYSAPVPTIMVKRGNDNLGLIKIMSLCRVAALAYFVHDANSCMARSVLHSCMAECCMDEAR